MGWDIDVKEKVSGRLANEIFFRIYDGTYQSGSKLPSILDIAKEAGSSPETVRKAVKKLVHKGIVNKTRSGFYVTSSRHLPSGRKEKNRCWADRFTMPMFCSTRRF